MDVEAANREFIDKKINPILEKLVVDLLINKPEDVVEFMIDWITTKKDSLKREIGYTAGESPTKRKESQEDSDDEVEDLPIPAAKKKGPRTSVSAEAYGIFNKKTAYVPKVVPKNDEQKRRIRQRLEQAFMFSALDEREKEIVVNAMEERRFKAGDTVIRQGEDGDNLYVVDSGQLDCFKQFSKNEQQKFLKTYQPGESFGELALLYNAPRAATIIAKSDCVLFALDRECFNGIVKDAASKKREKYEGFLSRVELLQAMDPYEKANVADALKPEKYRRGDFVVRQGDVGDTFFFIEEGEAIATKSMKPGDVPIEVYQYKAGDYFGELALLKNVTRQANIIAKTDLSLVKVDRDSFRRMMGPLEDILRRNMTRYQQYM
eukprot:TRINITY_DN1781_c0_g2_i1.p1 TRINITY_DN1781_c0_g2~~TRINITY_DN1781_c0_g2_i1.p1  ORF type:complete len:377 (-),score=133.11 TRINITY_DN1781_c0_g2_i1:170-1300(-)